MNRHVMFHGRDMETLEGVGGQKDVINGPCCVMNLDYLGLVCPALELIPDACR
ncbi:hypothetical protein [uncultured Ruegeria sp.]|uniref:hypothetical protein n=1 Tax=uncultured Ruegeria sp. TaxID=259304 RepID=UPI00263906AC|nr:hypothetical protein [uncultured Ruegeria sp.]